TPRVSRSQVALQMRLVGMASGSARNWIAVNAVNNPIQKQQMKTEQIMTKTTARTLWTTSLLAILLGTLLVGQARGQTIYETNDASSNTIGEYDATTGATINSSLVSGLNSPYGIVVYGGDIFVVNASGTIGEYDATTGATINSSLVSGLGGSGYGPIGLTEYGGNLFVVQNGPGHAQI